MRFVLVCELLRPSLSLGSDVVVYERLASVSRCSLYMLICSNFR